MRQLSRRGVSRLDRASHLCDLANKPSDYYPAISVVTTTPKHGRLVERQDDRIVVTRLVTEVGVVVQVGGSEQEQCEIVR